MIPNRTPAGKGKFPWDTAEHWGGACLCMGLVYFHSSCSGALIASALALTEEARDDQIGMNHAIEAFSNKPNIWGKKLSMVGNFDSLARLSFGPDFEKNKRRGSSYGVESSSERLQEISLKLVSHNAVPRVCKYVKDWDSVVIAHCHIADGKVSKTMKEKGNQVSHTDVLKRYGLWKLN